MTTMVWDEAGTRYYETGVSHGIFVSIDFTTVVPWNGLVAVNLDPQGGDHEAYYYDGVKYMERILAEEFQATVQSISTPKEFEPCEGIRESLPNIKTHFNKRDKFHMAWRTEIGNDEGDAIAYKWHIAYNCLVQPSSRAYSTIADSTTMDVRSFVITSTPACGRHSYFTFDTRDVDVTDLETQLFSGVLPKCYELGTVVGPAGGGGGGGTPADPDFGCPSMLEDFEEYFPGQTVDDNKVSDDGIQETSVYGVINNGLDITTLPASGDFAANDSAASEVGTHPVLVDDDDATYITSADGDLGYTVGLPTLVGYVPGCTLELHIRMSIDGDVNPDDPDNLDADAQVHISTDAGGDDTVGGFSDGTDEGMGFALTDVSGTPIDYVVPLKMDAWVNTTIDDVVTALAAGAYLNVVGATNNNPDTAPSTVNVYEASVVMVNSSESSRCLRGDSNNPTDYMSVQQGMYESDLSAYLTGSLTAEIDFKVDVVGQNDDVEGYLQQVIDWPDAFYVQIEPNDSPIKFSPSNVTLEGSNNHNESIVGTGDIWVDSSDTTYAEIRDEFNVDYGVVHGILPSLLSENVRAKDIIAATIKCRVASDSSADFVVRIDGYTDSGTLKSTGTSQSQTSGSSTITDFEIDLIDSESGSFFSDNIKAFDYDPRLVFKVLDAGIKLRVYEAWVELKVKAPLLKFWKYDQSEYYGDPLSLDLNTWYRAVADWTYTENRVRVYDRSSNTLLWDVSADDPVAPSENAYWTSRCGFIGGSG